MDAQIVLRWEHLVKQSGRSARAVSTAIGCNPTYLGQQFAKAKNAPQTLSDPSVTVALALARELDRSVEDLMGVLPDVEATPANGYRDELHRQSGKVISDLMNTVNRRMEAYSNRPTLEDVIGWWRSTSGKLVGASKIEEAFDLINVPSFESETVIPERVGAMSLAAETLHGPSVDRLTKLVQSLPKSDQSNLASTYRKAALSRNPVFSEPLQIDIFSPQNEYEQTVEYIRLLLPIEASAGTRFILNYCFRINDFYA
ncbi:hypothetical protein TG4357_02673 [Thalassovita gelatinovora]|uniref:Uncharacterized protein n=1 Tax=Thalassovita gelatinovora TaxID=53501 RepID=A0A0P1FFU6_THAGE|nr:hypothetical protein [Thalassovita gelatinovora]QIZ79799.1 hypothetical protein HFZ77_04535 [Thalassovita gelatinovora]CUH66844.1 hypothetical protein TG4357_02673 [Thalassovita gelatinovora]SEQ43774.1 hypothetical protein SAMN04488043_105210 [Thalassovita gelatinovora]